HCYCRDCQRSSGASHISAIAVPKAAMTISGTLKSVKVPADSGGTTVRHFCPDCGSTIYGEAEGEATANVVGGGLDDPGQVQPQAAIFVRSRPAWAKIEGDLPEFEAMPPMHG